MEAGQTTRDHRSEVHLQLITPRLTLLDLVKTIAVPDVRLRRNPRDFALRPIAHLRAQDAISNQVETKARDGLPAFI